MEYRSYAVQHSIPGKTYGGLEIPPDGGKTHGHRCTEQFQKSGQAGPIVDLDLCFALSIRDCLQDDDERVTTDIIVSFNVGHVSLHCPCLPLPRWGCNVMLTKGGGGRTETERQRQRETGTYAVIAAGVVPLIGAFISTGISIIHKRIPVIHGNCAGVARGQSQGGTLLPGDPLGTLFPVAA